MNENLFVFDLQAQLCQSLGHAIRLRIIHTLKDGPKTVSEIARMLDVSQPSISRHLSVLRSAGLLSAHRKGAEAFYELTNPRVIEVCEMMRSILAERESLQLDLLSSLNGEIGEK
jgi:ArsR family transcriptional regulator, virulence genes transcriptional regulator